MWNRSGNRQSDPGKRERKMHWKDGVLLYSLAKSSAISSPRTEVEIGRSLLLLISRPV